MLNSLFVSRCLIKSLFLLCIGGCVCLYMMGAAVVRAFCVFLYDLVMPQKSKSTGDICIGALRGFLYSMLFALMVQQIFLLTEYHGEKQEEYRRAVQLYTDEACATYKGSSQARLEECSRANIIIHSSPLVRALTKLTTSWTPWSTLIKNFTEQLQWKIMVLLVVMALATYVYSFFNCAKTRGKNYLEKYKAQKTQQDQMDNLSKKLDTLMKNNSIMVNV
jgi:hypothetical protein